MKQQTTNNKQQTTNNKQQTTNFLIQTILYLKNIDTAFVFLWSDFL